MSFCKTGHTALKHTFVDHIVVNYVFQLFEASKKVGLVDFLLLHFTLVLFN